MFTYMDTHGSPALQAEQEILQERGAVHQKETFMVVMSLTLSKGSTAKLLAQFYLNLQSFTAGLGLVGWVQISFWAPSNKTVSVYISILYKLLLYCAQIVAGCMAYISHSNCRSITVRVRMLRIYNDNFLKHLDTI